ncbi:MAG: DNA-directed RNA polymerase, subunit E'' [Candidatus Micrarchaeota archaeon]|nr:DNA-directed RNA polymerase, subunit E'' [Candidatus Micrarchaeota archaeon]
MKACKKCKLLVSEEDKCPICQTSELTEKFSGQLIVIDPEKSQIAQKLGAKLAGRYAIKIREK